MPLPFSPRLPSKGTAGVVDGGASATAAAAARRRRIADTAPMQADSYFKTRVERLTARGICLALALYLSAIGICAAVGSAAPTVFQSSGVSKSMSCNNFMCSPTFRGYLAELTAMHQVFYLEAQLERPYEYGHEMEDDFELDFDLSLIISAQGEAFVHQSRRDMEPLALKKKVVRQVHCAKGKLYCDTITLFAEDFLKFQGYHVQVTLEHPYVASGLVSEEGYDLVAEIRQEIESHTNVLTGTHGDGDNGDVSHAHSAVSGAVEAEQEIREEEEEEGSIFGADGPSDHAQELHEKLGIAAAADGLRFLPHSLSVSFEMRYITKAFTRFEFWVKYSAAFTSIVAAVLYIRGLRNAVDVKYWSYEQKWIVMLCVALVFYADPFFVLQVYSPGLTFTCLYILADITFLSMLLFFFLSVFDIIRSPAYWQERVTPRNWAFYLPKLVACSLLWCFCLAMFLYARLQTESDPTYYAMEDFNHYPGMKVVLDVLTWLIAARVLYLVARCMHAASLFHIKPKSHFIFIFTVTLVQVSLVVLGFSMGAYAPMVIYKESATVFFWANVNYVCFLCYAYYPDDGQGEVDLAWSRRNPNEHYARKPAGAPQRDLQMAAGISRSLPAAHSFKIDESMDPHTITASAAETRSPMASDFAMAQASRDARMEAAREEARIHLGEEHEPYRTEEEVSDLQG